MLAQNGFVGLRGVSHRNECGYMSISHLDAHKTNGQYPHIDVFLWIHNDLRNPVRIPEYDGQRLVAIKRKSGVKRCVLGCV